MSELDLEQRPFALREGNLPHLVGEHVEECELVESLVSIARLAVGREEGAGLSLIEVEARNFGRALRSELRRHHETVVAVVRDEMGADEAPVPYEVTEKGRRFQEANSSLATIAPDEDDRLAQHEDSSIADDTIELVLGSALDAGETYRYGGKELYRGPCAGGCGRPVNGVASRGRYARRHAECR